MNIVFNKFAELLDQRLMRNVLMTEDSMRYTFFASMLANSIKPDDVILEYPHPAIPRALIDTWIQSETSQPIAIEFKYDRGIPCGKNQPKTQKAGAVFHDIDRLRLTQHAIGATCFLVYVTTTEMMVYFKNPTNGHSTFFNLQPGKTLEIKSEYFSTKPMTFMRKVGEKFEANVTNVMSRELAANHALRIYEVVSPGSAGSR